MRWVANMRLVAPGPVVVAAEDALKAIVEAYLEPNRSLREIQTLAQAGELDFLSRFGEEGRIAPWSRRTLSARDNPSFGPIADI
jgi:hypothetical protein